MVYVGIDVAKDFHECAILSQDKEVLLAPFSFSNTKEGFVYLKEMINLAGNADPLNVKIGLEATGHYSVALLSFLEHNGWRIIYLNPLSVAIPILLFISNTNKSNFCCKWAAFALVFSI